MRTSARADHQGSGSGRRGIGRGEKRGWVLARHQRVSGRVVQRRERHPRRNGTLVRKQSKNRGAVRIASAAKHARRVRGWSRGYGFVTAVLRLGGLRYLSWRLLPAAGGRDEGSQRRGLEQKPDRDAHAQAPPDHRHQPQLTGRPHAGQCSAWVRGPHSWRRCPRTRWPVRGSRMRSHHTVPRLVPGVNFPSVSVVLDRGPSFSEGNRVVTPNRTQI